MDAVLWAVGRHPGCRSSSPISDQAEASLIATLNQHLGAVEIETDTTKETKP